MPKKSFGQHFLHERGVIGRIMKTANLQKNDYVMEVGPGEGVLTREIIQVVDPKHVVLIEADRDLITHLQEEFPKTNVIYADAATIDPNEYIHTPWIFLSNLPYNAGAAIFMNMLRAKCPPVRSVIMVQKEVGEKMLAQPGNMSVLSVAVGLYAQGKKISIVKPGAFRPAPKVDSMILEFVTREDRPAKAESIIGFVKEGFSSRRKQLFTNLKAKGYGVADLESAFLQADVSKTTRAQELHLKQWQVLHDALVIGAE